MVEICNLIPLNGELDLTSTTGILNIMLNRNADLLITECFVEITQNIVASSTEPVICLMKNNNEVSQINLTNGILKGKIKFFPKSETLGELINISSSDEIKIICKTAATGTSPAGKVRAFIGIK